MQVIARVRECKACLKKSKVRSEPWKNKWLCDCGNENHIDHAGYIKSDDVFIMG